MNNQENRYRVEVTIPIWIYMEDAYMKAMDFDTQETIMNKIAEGIEWGYISSMDVSHWRVSLDNPTVSWDEDTPIPYYPTGLK